MKYSNIVILYIRQLFLGQKSRASCCMAVKQNDFFSYPTIKESKIYGFE